ncbi:hypothetical protein FDF74_11490 [Clostridium niameyense]|uniref:Uncharacterized protein n=1 Tax=Clostridium niameyense TaxID=1622073 RepID=A0A6M0RC39_9CLOT|nr:hypothetical protein [Clostridium niameyense]NEZ47804.1 hypothetical protein [Clostridium niameyense]
MSLFKEDRMKSKEQLNISSKFKITKVVDIEDATHWIPTYDENIPMNSAVTVGGKYRLVYDKFEDEDCIIDDDGHLSLIYLCHNGDFVKMEEVIYEE